MTRLASVTCFAIASIGVSAQIEPVAAQDDGRINIYRYVLGVDVPQAPALVAMGVAPNQVLLGSAPKPLSATVLAVFGRGGETQLGAAVDVAPYYFLGGGVRELESYRSGSLAGRALRVLTKTLLSFAAVRTPADPTSPLVSVGLRSTFHDPHDPISNTALPENIAAALARAQYPLTDIEEEGMDDRGVDLAPVYAAARRESRARAGDAQVSAGWGVTARAVGGALGGSDLDDARHALWVTAQYTTGARYDVIATVQFRNAFHDDDRFWLGAALRRKRDGADVQAGLYYDTASKQLHPGVAVDSRLSQHLGVVVSLTAQADPPQLTGPRRIRFGVMGRWFAASDRP